MVWPPNAKPKKVARAARIGRELGPEFATGSNATNAPNGPIIVPAPHRLVDVCARAQRSLYSRKSLARWRFQRSDQSSRRPAHSRGRIDLGNKTHFCSLHKAAFCVQKAPTLAGPSSGWCGRIKSAAIGENSPPCAATNPHGSEHFSITLKLHRKDRVHRLSELFSRRKVIFDHQRNLFKQSRKLQKPTFFNLLSRRKGSLDELKLSGSITSYRPYHRMGCPCQGRPFLLLAVLPQHPPW